MWMRTYAISLQMDRALHERMGGPLKRTFSQHWRHVQPNNCYWRSELPDVVYWQWTIEWRSRGK